VSAARAAGHVHPDGMAGWPRWSAEEHLRLMDSWGVATAMLSISSPGAGFVSGLGFSLRKSWTTTP
jgi:hypothetical protein